MDALLAEDRPLDLRRDVWPLMAKEIGYGHYHELFHAHPGRTTLPWEDFAAAYDRLGWYDPEMTELVASAVPDPADRLDFEALDRPLDGLAFSSPDAFQDHLRTYVSEDVARRENPEFSADLGAFLALLSLYGQLPRLVGSGRLTARSVAGQLDGWWQGFFSFLASGPPGFRLRQLLALSEAGVVRFLGADVRIAADESTGAFTAASPTVPGHTTHATALIEAYLPRPASTAPRTPCCATCTAPGRSPRRSSRTPRSPTARDSSPCPPWTGGSSIRHWAGRTRGGSRWARPPTAAPSPRSPGPAPTPGFPAERRRGQGAAAHAGGGVADGRPGVGRRVTGAPWRPRVRPPRP